jgi:hypothetical protein
MTTCNAFNLKSLTAKSGQTLAKVKQKQLCRGHKTTISREIKKELYFRITKLYKSYNEPI